MILAEPPPSQGDFYFSLFGYPVRIHILFWLVAAVMGIRLQQPLLIGIWVISMLVCILLHELGHSVVMRAYGFEPSIVLYSFGGLAIPHAGRYSIRRPGPWGQILISLAGPASGFLLAVVLLLGLRYLRGYPIVQDVRDFPVALHAGDNFVEVFKGSWRDVVPVWREVVELHGNLYLIDRADFLGSFVNFVFEITIYWGLLNLLPIYPLDGGQIAQQVFVLNDPRDAIRQSLILSVIVGGLMIAISLIQWKSIYLALFFGYMTYSNYTTLQSSQDRGGW